MIQHGVSNPLETPIGFLGEPNAFAQEWFGYETGTRLPAL